MNTESSKTQKHENLLVLRKRPTGGERGGTAVPCLRRTAPAQARARFMGQEPGSGLTWALHGFPRARPGARSQVRQTAAGAGRGRGL